MRVSIRWRRYAVVLSAILAMIAPTAGAASTLTGKARVVDGDTLSVAGVRIRLEGIDAPELAQQCTLAGRPWRAGKSARQRLVRLIADHPVTCRSLGRDGYGRIIASCQAAGRDLAGELVRAGLAWAFVRYSTTFVAEEQAARRAGLGVWQGRCETAWAFRRNRWTRGASAAPAGCAIKGNISNNGRIYHMPWSPWYAKTRIDPARGERWFCNETEARNAGWRPSAI